MKNKWIYFLIGIVLVVITVFITLNQTDPAFYDPLGFVTFSFLIAIGIYMLRKPKNPPEWIWFFLILVGVLGIIIDGSIVLREFIFR